MSRFIAVFHTWHVHSRGFEQADLQAVERDQALDEAAGILYHADDGFYRRDFCLVEVSDTEHRPRRLTWRERFTGRLSGTVTRNA